MFSKGTLTALALCATALGNAGVYYGFDYNSWGTVPLTVHPNHDAAKASFLGAVSTYGVDDLEALSTGAQASSSLHFGAAANGSMTTGTGPGVNEAQIRNTSEYDAFAFSGKNFFLGLGDPGVTLLTIKLDRKVTAVGFSISDEADWGQSSNPGHEVVLNNGEVYSLTPNKPYNISSGSVSFWGVTSATPFDSFSIRYPSNGIGTGTNADALGIDDIIVANPVPEPMTMAALGLGVLALVRRRKA